MKLQEIEERLRKALVVNPQLVGIVEWYGGRALASDALETIVDLLLDLERARVLGTERAA